MHAVMHQITFCLTAPSTHDSACAQAHTHTHTQPTLHARMHFLFFNSRCTCTQTVNNIMCQLAHCALAGIPLGDLVSVQRRMASFIVHYTECIQPWLEFSYVTWEDRHEVPEISQLKSQPRFQALLGGGSAGHVTAGGSISNSSGISALDSMRVLESFPPPPPGQWRLRGLRGSEEEAGQEGQGAKEEGVEQCWDESATEGCLSLQLLAYSIAACVKNEIRCVWPLD